jgi:hypothetical protein
MIDRSLIQMARSIQIVSRIGHDPSADGAGLSGSGKARERSVAGFPQRHVDGLSPRLNRQVLNPVRPCPAEFVDGADERDDIEGPGSADQTVVECVG